MLTLECIRIEQGPFHLSADFSVQPQRKTAVIGPSGAGKSTLLGAIGGFVPLKNGSIIWNGKDITHDKPGARPIAMLFQDNNLFPHLSVTQNVGLGLRPDMRLDDQDRTRIALALDRVGLKGFSDRKPGALSGGQQSRAALARILVQDRPIVLLDEPFAALGPALRREMLDLVASLMTETKATLLMVTHDPDDARHIADDVVFVAEAQATAPQPAAELLDDPPPALRAYLG